MFSENSNSLNNVLLGKYDNVILPKLDILEDKRKEMIKNAFIAMLVWTAMCGIFSLFAIFLIKDYPKIFITALYFLSLYLLYSSTKKDFERDIKKELFPIVSDDFVLNYEIIKERSDSDTLYSDLYIIPAYKYLYYEDLFSGNYKNVKLDIKELKTEKECCCGFFDKKVFKGVVISFEMNKNFKGNTVILSDTARHASPSKNLHHTVLEDVEFEKKFDVYTNDDVEARYLITTALMERLNNLQVAFNTDKISAAFRDNKFYIALSSKKDLFFVGSILKNINTKTQFVEFFKELSSVIMLIEYFKLEERTGL